jgi:MATE family multidrug resistance protein
MTSNNPNGLDPFSFRTNEVNPNAHAPVDISSTSAPASSQQGGFGSWRQGLGSWAASSPIAAQAIAQDAEDEPDEPSDDGSSMSDASTVRPIGAHSMSNAYRRPSFFATGPRGAVLSGQVLGENVHLSKRERERMRDEERSLLRDNSLIPRKHPQSRASDDNIGAQLGKKFSIGSGLRKIRSSPQARDEESGVPDIRVDDHDEVHNGEATETSALLGRDPQASYGGEDSPKTIDRRWEEAVTKGMIQTTWQREAKVLGKYSRSLIATFILQYSLTMASIFTVGHIGKVELGAVSLASMTANITGYAVYQGLSTSLDTLCAQAFGSGRKTLVGLQLQRMVYFLWLVTIPIGIIWLSSTHILAVIVPEKETARLAGLYLKVILAGAPGYAAFECGKRFVQAQGLFHANLYVLLICAPINAVMNYLLVWRVGLGFVGAPIAVAITDNMLPLVLFLYVYFIDGKQCWGGFSRNAFKNWIPMIKLALPGLVMVLAEFLAFEILTLAASWIGSTHLAAQSVLSTITALTFQIPFPISIAASTRIANLIGATLSEPAKMAAKVALVAAVFVGILNVTLLSSLRSYIPMLFTNDEDVQKLVADILPLCAAFQLFDALAASCNGILRGLGRQEVGGYVNLFAYYAVRQINPMIPVLH